MDNTNFIPPTTPDSKSKVKWAFAGIAALVIVAGAGYQIANLKATGKVAGANTSYQAVFLTNGQVYFGKLMDQGDWINLSDIYYLQVTQPLQQTATGDQSKTASPASATDAAPQSNIQLVKLGAELHGPTDSMHIERDKVLFWEDMKDDSKVVQAIHQYKAK